MKELKRNRILKTLSDATERIDIFLKAPSAKESRKSFIIYRRNRKTGKTETLRPDELLLINKELKEGKISFDQAKLHVRNIIEKLRTQTKQAVLFNEENLKILDSYWEAEYTERDISAPESARSRLQQAVEAVGHLSLKTSAREDLQAFIDHRHKGNKQRRIVAALNQIFRWLGRNIKLRKAREEIRLVRYLNQEEFKQVLRFLPEDENIRLIHKVAFATGCRLGEIFALGPSSIEADGRTLNVMGQLDKEFKPRTTKNRRIRKTYILEGWESSVKEWLLVPDNVREPLRGCKYSIITRTACIKAFPDRRNKHCIFRDLRHCYAIDHVMKNVSISLISQYLGNGVEVCHKYYVGFVAIPESIKHTESMRQNKI